MAQGDTGKGKNRDEALDTAASAEYALQGFLRAFADLDWDAFRAGFDHEATAFFPRGDCPARAEGREQVERVFRCEFEEARASGAGPPYLDLRPQDLRIQEIGDTALVSFHLALPGALRRRTIIFRKRVDGWKILHLHASNTPTTTVE
jgi:ketosteroid isomerase-like protein